jgi:hypothetical protein
MNLLIIPRETTDRQTQERESPAKIDFAARSVVVSTIGQTAGRRMTARDRAYDRASHL